MTNPDTSTLNGALEQLGITMAENLVTQGVTDADPSDGLTTLANKILDITPGPGPTPTPASIDLTGTKSILSYEDSESSVLTATVLDSSDNPVEGATVELYKAGVLWDTLSTDSSGECSKTYTSAGIGDVSFEAKCNLLTKTYAIEDCWDYDTTTRNLAPNSSLSQIDSFSFTNTGDWEVEWIMKLPSGKSRVVLYNSANANVFLGIGASENGNRIIYWYGHEEGYSTFSYNTDYTMKIVKEGSNFKIYSQGSLLKTMTYSDLLNTSTINLGLRNWGSGTGTIRNVKIKPL